MTNNNDNEDAGELAIPWHMSDTTYNTLKWAVMVLLPAFSTLYFTLSDVLDLPAVTQVIGTIAALCTFLGIFLRRSNIKYAEALVRLDAARTYDNHIVVTRSESGVMNFSLELGTQPEDMLENDTVVFKVDKSDLVPPVG